MCVCNIPPRVVQCSSMLCLVGGGGGCLGDDDAVQRGRVGGNIMVEGLQWHWVAGAYSSIPV